MKDVSGRKTKLTWATYIGPFAVSSMALFLGEMPSTVWASFMGFLIPTILGIHHGANVYQKIKVAKEVK